MKKIVLTGGGTAGHVMPNIALLPYLKDFEIHYIGSRNGIEKDIISRYPQVTYHEIDTGKLRRYCSWKNVGDFFRFQHGIYESRLLRKKIKPDIIFSKGGYVSVPVAAAARGAKVPLVSHESDYTPGLANKLITKVACKVLTTFPETVSMIKQGKGEFCGAPIREDLFEGSREKGLEFLGFDGTRPVVTVMGGSKGSRAVNKAVTDALDALLEKYAVVHICGERNVSEVPDGLREKGYRQYGFIADELKDVLACTDVMITRGGSNSIHEFAALKIPMIIIPLPGKKTSRGDQILNAVSFEKRGLAVKLEEEEIVPGRLEALVDEVYSKREEYRSNFEKAAVTNGTENIYRTIEEVLAKKDAES